MQVACNQPSGSGRTRPTPPPTDCRPTMLWEYVIPANSLIHTLLNWRSLRGITRPPSCDSGFGGAVEGWPETAGRRAIHTLSVPHPAAVCRFTVSRRSRILIRVVGPRDAGFAAVRGGEDGPQAVQDEADAKDADHAEEEGGQSRADGDCSGRGRGEQDGSE